MFRFSLAMFFAAALSVPLCAEGPTVEPYVAFVRADDCFVRSGPAEDYYRTDPIPFGAEIEVYLESPDGWLGIRPPDSSFSWVPASQVEMDEEHHTARVVDPQAVAWIGTNLGKAKKFRWQVKLSAGEELVVLDQVMHESASGKQQMWLQVVPPAGEFRWIHRKDVVLSRKGLDQLIAEREEVQQERIARGRSDVSPASFQQSDSSRRQTPHEIADVSAESAAEGEDPAPAPSDQPGGAQAERNEWSAVAPGAARTSRPSDADTANAVSIQPIGSGVAPASYADAPSAEPEAAGSEWQRSGTSLRSGPRLVDSTPSITDSSSLRQPDAGRRSTGNDNPPAAWSLTAAQVADLTVQECQVEFPRAVVAEASSEQLAPLAERVRTLSETAEDKFDRARAIVLLERIDRYQGIARRRDEPVDLDGQKAAEHAGYSDEATGRPNFDREGYLVQVYSARPNAPPFALTDRTGETIAYISPAPGLNLRRYLNEAVGIVGRTGYLTGLDTPHLIAERVVKLTP